MFTISLQVRDYELDAQGIVNNAVYQNYLEHARHQYLHSIGIDFAGLAKQKVNLVVVRAEIDYRASLVANDNFKVSVKMEKESRIKFAFMQQIIRASDDKVMLEAKIIGTCLNERGRPKFPPEIERLMDENSETY